MGSGLPHALDRPNGNPVGAPGHWRAGPYFQAFDGLENTWSLATNREKYLVLIFHRHIH
jgi:hypothetical protein